MRLNTLFALVAPLVLLLPLSAHADWPKGERDKYMAQCTQAATPQIGAAKAKSHCACGADAIKSYPARDIQALMDKRPPPNCSKKPLARSPNARLMCPRKSEQPESLMPPGAE